MKRHTIVIEGGQVGAALALTVAITSGLSEPKWYVRKDKNVQVSALAPEADKSARSRWVSKCKALGLTVVPAPWERTKAERKVERAVAKAGA